MDVPLTEGLGVGLDVRSSVKIFPAICPIKVANSEAADRGWLEEPNVHFNHALRLRIHRKDVRCASASATADEASCSFAPNVVFGSIRVDADNHRTQGIEGPQGTEPPADGAIAACNRLWRMRQRNLDRAAVAAGWDHRVLLGLLSGDA